MNSRERLMLILGILLLGVVCLKFFVYDPQQVAYADLEQTRDSASADLLRHQQIMLRSGQVRAQYRALAGQLASVEAKLPKDDEIPALLTAMQQFTTDRGLRIISISPGEPHDPTVDADAKGAAAHATSTPKSAPYAIMPLKLTVRGTFPQVVHYFRDLGTFPRLVVVNSISVAPERLPQLIVSMDAEIYVLEVPTVVPPVRTKP